MCDNIHVHIIYSFPTYFVCIKYSFPIDSLLFLIGKKNEKGHIHSQQHTYHLLSNEAITHTIVFQLFKSHHAYILRTSPGHGDHIHPPTTDHAIRQYGYACNLPGEGRGGLYAL